MMYTVVTMVLFLMIRVLLCCTEAFVSVENSNVKINELSGQAETCRRCSLALRSGRAEAPFPVRTYRPWLLLAL